MKENNKNSSGKYLIMDNKMLLDNKKDDLIPLE
jgi:hypothetical protein